MSPRSPFLAAAIERGFVHQCTDLEALDARLSAGRVTAYVGYDCTADSLHVGSLVSIMLLRLWQQSGHKPIVLMGGGTTRIGDPSFRDAARPLLGDAEIARNMAGIRKVFTKFVEFGDGPSDAVMVNNADWLDELRYIPVLRDIGRHFSVNRMLTQDSVRLRLEREQPLSFLEFNYPILQAYDFVELARRLDCAVQIGGSDQWGNIVGGVELGRRMDGRTLFGLTTPLLTTASGDKMGKTAQGAVWLNAERLSPYEYWQFWRNTEDADVGRFLRLFTELPLDEITRLKQGNINEAKERLATEATTLCHGREEAERAAQAAHALFRGVAATAAAPGFAPPVEPLSGVAATAGVGSLSVPAHSVPRGLIERGIAAFELFAGAGLAASKGEARRLIRGGGARINDALVEDETRMIRLDDFGSDGVLKLSAGRKRHVFVRPL
ncbi:MAG TPA: tyrosine--tRNA ligase [Stellaceae bacterium]|nr:tyrosine--tRNA ligase [Stellaceae bacterium]